MKRKTIKNKKILTVPSAPGPLATPAASNAAPTACSDASNAPARLEFSLKLSIQCNVMGLEISKKDALTFQEQPTLVWHLLWLGKQHIY